MYGIYIVTIAAFLKARRGHGEINFILMLESGRSMDLIRPRDDEVTKKLLRALGSSAA
jgi:hypothetical protein